MFFTLLEFKWYILIFLTCILKQIKSVLKLLLFMSYSWTNKMGCSNNRFVLVLYSWGRWSSSQDRVLPGTQKRTKRKRKILWYFMQEQQQKKKNITSQQAVCLWKYGSPCLCIPGGIWWNNKNVFKQRELVLAVIFIKRTTGMQRLECVWKMIWVEIQNSSKNVNEEYNMSLATAECTDNIQTDLVSHKWWVKS